MFNNTSPWHIPAWRNDPQFLALRQEWYASPNPSYWARERRSWVIEDGKFRQLTEDDIAYDVPPGRIWDDRFDVTWRIDVFMTIISETDAAYLAQCADVQREAVDGLRTMARQGDKWSQGALYRIERRELYTHPVDIDTQFEELF